MLKKHQSTQVKHKILEEILELITEVRATAKVMFDPLQTLSPKLKD